MTRAYVGLLLLNLIFVFVGASLLGALGLARDGRSTLRLGGLCLFGGWAVSELCLGALVPLGIDPGVAELVVQSLVLIAVALIVRRYFKPAAMIASGGTGSLGAWLVSVAGALVLLFSLATAVVVGWRTGADSSWDVWAFWIPKAKAIYYFHGLDTGLSGFTTYANPGYPPAAPAMTATAFHLMGASRATVLPFQQTVLSIGFVAGTVGLLCRRVPAWIVLPLIAMLSLAPEFWNRIPSVLPDQSVGYLMATAALATVLYLEEQRRGWLVLAAVMLGAAAVTKAEGFMLGIGLAAAATIVSIVRRRERWLTVLFVGPAAILPWQVWLSRHHQSMSGGLYTWSDLLKPHYLSSRFGRLSYAARHLVDLVFSLSDWRVVLPLALAAALFAARRQGLVPAILALWLLISFAGLATVYWIGAPDVHWYVATSAQRVIGTLPIVAGSVTPYIAWTALRSPPTARGRTAVLSRAGPHHADAATV